MENKLSKHSAVVNFDCSHPDLVREFSIDITYPKGSRHWEEILTYSELSAILVPILTRYRPTEVVITRIDGLNEE